MLNSTSHHRDHSGCFISQCIAHVQSASNENHDLWSTLKLTGTGRSPHDAVAAWFLGPASSAPDARVTIEDCGGFGCNPMCQNYTYTGGEP